MDERIFSGRLAFDLMNANGLPLAFTVDRVIGDAGRPISWVDFIRRGRACHWNDYQILRAMHHGLQDGGMVADYVDNVMARARLWIMRSFERSDG